MNKIQEKLPRLVILHRRHLRISLKKVKKTM